MCGRLIVRGSFSNNQLPEHGPLQLPGVAGSSSSTALTGSAAKLCRTAKRSGPDGQGLMAKGRVSLSSLLTVRNERKADFVLPVSLNS